MRVVIAIDSFKGSLSSIEAGSAVREAVLKLKPDADVSVLPLADGGEGTVAAMCAGLGGEMITVSVTGPNSAPVEAGYCILGDGTAVIEMSAAAGITLIDPTKRDPLTATTYGVGELIRDAVNRGNRRFLVGIGGSATNDGGAGMLEALGFELLNGRGEKIPRGAVGLAELSSISSENVLLGLGECTFRVACDVTNPLCGKNGCSAVFGPQKGADPAAVEKMDKWLGHYARVAKTVSENADADFPGCGAAGVLGFAFMAFLGASLESGVGILLEETRLEEQIKTADIVVTGEGRLDAQTVMGKAPIGVARLAKKYGKRVIAFSGCVSDGAEICNEHGIDAFFPILRSVTTLEEALDRETACKNLTAAAEQVFRLIF